MNDMKCPICQSNLHKINIVVSTCTNDKCKLWGSSIPNLVLKALAQAKQDLEQSEKCCSAWETQALDYKAENIALSGELERTRKALDVAVNMLKRIDETRSGVKENLHATNGRTLNAGNGFCWATIDDIHNALDKITALTKGGDDE